MPSWRTSLSKFASSGPATTWSPARQEPSERSRKESSFAWRALRSQPAASTSAPGLAALEQLADARDAQRAELRAEPRVEALGEVEQPLAASGSNVDIRTS